MEPVCEGRASSGESSAGRFLRIIQRDIGMTLEILDGIVAQMGLSAREAPAERLRHMALVERAEASAEELRRLSGEAARLAGRPREASPCAGRSAHRASSARLAPRAAV